MCVSVSLLNNLYKSSPHGVRVNLKSLSCTACHNEVALAFTHSLIWHWRPCRCKQSCLLPQDGPAWLPSGVQSENKHRHKTIQSDRAAVLHLTESNNLSYNTGAIILKQSLKTGYSLLTGLRSGKIKVELRWSPLDREREKEENDTHLNKATVWTDCQNRFGNRINKNCACSIKWCLNWPRRDITELEICSTEMLTKFSRKIHYVHI